MPENHDSPEFHFLTSEEWTDYELLDSGGGAKLERYGQYIFKRPEHQALWKRALPEKNWLSAHAFFKTTGSESGGNWEFHKTIDPTWKMGYKGLKFYAQASSSRHMGVFPEQAAHWDWITELIPRTTPPVRVLNLFGYTGLATLAAAQAGAQVTHVDASKKAITIARQNQSLSGLDERSIRWLVDDAFKFVGREVRRETHYEGIILDPPKFGRGPQGQVWELFEALPNLLADCRKLLSEKPLFIVLTAYAIRASALSAYYALKEIVADLGGTIETGELALRERSAGRLLSTAIFARWHSNK